MVTAKYEIPLCIINIMYSIRNVLNMLPMAH